jgi:hypothetical protein
LSTEEKIGVGISKELNVVSRLTPEQTDSEISSQIAQATREDSNIWTHPDFNRREYVHSFFQYPAMMVPAVQKKLIEIILGCKPGVKNMVDPFMGSATTLVTCMEYGLNCYGQDINPLAVLIAQVRTGPYYVDALKEKFSHLMNLVEQDKSEVIEAEFKGLNKWFKPLVALDLSRIVRAIRKEKKLAIRKLYWVILAEVVRLSSNDRTSTFKLHIRSESEINGRNFSPIDVFKLHMDDSIEDYESHAKLLLSKDKLSKRSYKYQIDVRLWDSKKAVYCPQKEPFYDLLVTSPPYGDNRTTVTYGQHSYLPLQWLDLDDIAANVSNEFLKSTCEIDSRSLGGKLFQLNNEKLKDLLNVSSSFLDTYSKINIKAPEKIKKVAAFVLDLNAVLDNIFTVMKPNSYQIWTTGNRNVAGFEIPNDRIITELMEHKGGKLVARVEREILNKRMARRNKETALMNTEDILIFRKNA